MTLTAPVSWLEFVDRSYEEQILQIRNERMGSLLEPKYKEYQDALTFAPDIESEKVNLDQSSVQCLGQLSPENFKLLKKSLQAFMPWKKGPFSIFDVEIDAEWKSDLKWDRIKPFLKPLDGHVVADIGCHNGYHMFRMAAENPKAVIGFEPFGKHWFNFQLLNKYLRQENLFFELLGVEHINLFPQSFDTIFCLGILYHHTDPIGLLRKMRGSLKKGGQVIIDCQGIAGDDPVAYVPQSKYAGGRGYWFLPTLSCLNNWIRRAGFQKVETIFAEKLSSDEQRTSEWAPIKSLQDFLDESGEKTIEGHPAPWRFYVKASL